MPGHKYKNAPIDEATCQFTLAEQIPWDTGIPGRLFDYFKDRYPGMPSQQQLIQANLTPAVGLPSPNLAFVQSDRVVFVDSSGADRLSVGPGTVSIHRGQPYIGFEEELLPRIRGNLPEVLQVLDHESLFTAVSVRYINKIVINKPEFNLDEYFSYWGAESALPGSFDGNIVGFFYRTAAKRTGHPETFTLTFGSIDAPKDSSAFLLDIDLAHQFDNAVSIDQAVDHLIELKALENSIFESLITDECRRLFE